METKIDWVEYDGDNLEESFKEEISDCIKNPDNIHICSALCLIEPHDRKVKNSGRYKKIFHDGNRKIINSTVEIYRSRYPDSKHEHTVITFKNAKYITHFARMDNIFK